jgi:heptosyltransferase-3
MRHPFDANLQRKKWSHERICVKHTATSWRRLPIPFRFHLRIDGGRPELTLPVDGESESRVSFRKDISQVKTLIIRPAALGDTLMLVPAMVQMSASTEVVLVCKPPSLEILRPYVEQAVDYEGPEWHRLFLDKHDGHLFLTVPQVDRAVAFLNDLDGTVEKNLKVCLPGASVHLFPAFPPEGIENHVAWYLAECLKRAGLPADPEKALETARDRALLKREPTLTRQQKTVFHPGSGGQAKNHPPDFWVELIDESSKAPFLRGHDFVVLLGPAEEPLHPFFTQNLPHRNTQILFSPESEDLISLLEKASLYVGHDSGITHLSAMLGTPTIALFKNSSVSRWSPLGPAARVIQSEETSPNLIGKILRQAQQVK